MTELDGLNAGDYVTIDYLKRTGILTSHAFNHIYTAFYQKGKSPTDQDVKKLNRTDVSDVFIIQYKESTFRQYPELGVNYNAFRGVVPITILNQKSDVTSTEKTLWRCPQNRYVRQETAAVVSVVSTSAQDTNLTGTGIWTMKISGLDGDYAFQQEVVEMNGLTPVLTTKSYIAINELNPETAGTAKTAIGNISCEIGGNILSSVCAETVSNISRQIVFTVPAGTRFIVDNVELSCGSGDEVIANLYAVNPVNGIYVLQHTIYFIGGGNVISLGDDGIIFPEKHLLEMTALASGGAVNRDVSSLVSGKLIIEGLAS